MSSSRRAGLAAILGELRRELKRRGVRIGELAAQIGVAEPTIWRWLRGEGLTLDRLDDICAAIDLDLRDLLARGHDEQQSFTLAQERILAADRGLALVFFAILHGAQRSDLVDVFALPLDRLTSHLDRLQRLGLIEAAVKGRLRATVSRAVRWRQGGPLAVAFERTVKPLFMSMDFGSPDALYVSDMVPLTEVGRARVQALLETVREDIQLIGQQEQAARLPNRHWSGILLMIRPFDIGEMTSEWRGGASQAALRPQR